MEEASLDDGGEVIRDIRNDECYYLENYML